ncbi:MAG: tetratricopeptide repeat protein, partial [Rhodanobacteraceae bacterium]
LVYQSLLHPKLRPQALAAVQQLAHYQSNPGMASNLLQLWLALGENDQALKQLQGICPAQPVGCSDLAINPIYAPLRSDSAFQKLAKQYTTATLQ